MRIARCLARSLAACLLLSAPELALASARSGSERAPVRPPEGRWVRIFNGRNLDGWTPKFAGSPVGENYRNTFRVERGRLKVSYDEYERFDGEFGHLFYRTKHSHYRIRVEYRFSGRQVDGGPGWALFNNGIMIHSQPPESMGLDQKFPVSIEAQLLGDDGTGKRTTGNVCTPGTLLVMAGKLVREHCIVTSTTAVAPRRWTTMEVEVRGSRLVRHRVNGKVVSEYESLQLDPDDPDAQKLLHGAGTTLSEGYIALQAETHPIEFRKVELLVLPDDE